NQIGESTMKSQPIERIPIAQIRVVNPRPRNGITFRSIINNIGLVGLKKPITVFRRPMERDGTQYDLVYGQGRMEAVAALGESEIPAILTEAPKRERYLMSLIENVARKQPAHSDLLKEIRSLQKRGYSKATIGEKLGLAHTYIDGIFQLLKKGEDQLVERVEAGAVPLSIAVKIATTGNSEVQRALTDAYDKGEVRGAKLRSVQRLIIRRATAKKLGNSHAPELTGREWIQEFECQTIKQRELLKRAALVHERLAILPTC
ncbi:MAG TPA: ParB/RepB/Spo0J family partition protein, partial [Bryobacteraceae bacterium]|nr:ParB/RepB/Spo0J family partition protein [Bryobacteraceae bacterium]